MYNRLVHYTLASLVFILFFFFMTGKALAQDYVLPYPSFMPGNPFYKVSQTLDFLEEKWSFGSFAKFKYNLKMTDKKLVEARALFDYKQYLLASFALKQADDYFKKLPIYLERAQREGKNISQEQKTLKEAARKHLEILDSTGEKVPEAFIWQPEKKVGITLSIGKMLEESTVLRKKVL